MKNEKKLSMCLVPVWWLRTMTQRNYGSDCKNKTRLSEEYTSAGEKVAKRVQCYGEFSQGESLESWRQSGKQNYFSEPTNSNGMIKDRAFFYRKVCGNEGIENCISKTSIVLDDIPRISNALTLRMTAVKIPTHAYVEKTAMHAICKIKKK